MKNYKWQCTRCFHQIPFKVCDFSPTKQPVYGIVLTCVTCVLEGNKGLHHKEHPAIELILEDRHR